MYGSYMRINFEWYILAYVHQLENKWDLNRKHDKIAFDEYLMLQVTYLFIINNIYYSYWILFMTTNHAVWTCLKPSRNPLGNILDHQVHIPKTSPKITEKNAK